jgi:antitoxin (DNA-binding transcriptional repressor) of toxin-antitoxin stability system
MKVSAQYAETHLSDLISAADNGEVVEIARPDKPTLKLVISTSTSPAKQAGRRILGAGRGELRAPSEQEWRDMDKELERQMNDPSLMTSGEI